MDAPTGTHAESIYPKYRAPSIQNIPVPLYGTLVFLGPRPCRYRSCLSPQLSSWNLHLKGAMRRFHQEIEPGANSISFLTLNDFGKVTLVQLELDLSGKALGNSYLNIISCPLWMLLLLSTLRVSGISGTRLPASLISGCDLFFQHKYTRDLSCCLLVMPSFCHANLSLPSNNSSFTNSSVWAPSSSMMGDKHHWGRPHHFMQ